MGFFNIKKKVKNKDKQQILNENYQETYQEPTAKAKTEANKRQREHFNQVTKYERDRIDFHKTMGKVGLGFGAAGLVVALISVGAVFILPHLKRLSRLLSVLITVRDLLILFSR